MSCGYLNFLIKIHRFWFSRSFRIREPPVFKSFHMLIFNTLLPWAASMLLIFFSELSKISKKNLNPEEHNFIKAIIEYSGIFYL